MTTSNYRKTKITLDDNDQKTLDKAIYLLGNMWDAAPEDTDFETEVYTAYTILTELCEKAKSDSKGNLYWEEQTEIIEQARPTLFLLDYNSLKEGIDKAGAQ